MSVGVLGVLLLSAQLAVLHVQASHLAKLPTCPPPSSDPGKDIFYPNAENCSNYYHCDNGILVNLECPQGLYFCSKQEVCTWSWGCTFSDCKIVNKLNLLQPKLPACPPPSSEPGDDILYPNPENCSNYFHCDNGNVVSVDCPPGLYFCSKERICTWPWDCQFQDCKVPSARLHVRDEPICPVPVPGEEEGNVTQLPNPANCSTYYKCANGAPVLQECPAGLYYCAEKEVCTWTWDCDFSNCKKDGETSYRLGFPKIRNDILLLFKKFVYKSKLSEKN